VDARPRKQGVLLPEDRIRRGIGAVVLFVLVFVGLAPVWDRSHVWVTIDSNPSGACLTIDERQYDRTPFSRYFQAGRKYSIELVATNHTPLSTELEVGQSLDQTTQCYVLDDVQATPRPEKGSGEEPAPVVAEPSSPGPKPLGCLRDFYVPSGWPILVVAPVTELKSSWSWEVDGLTVSPTDANRDLEHVFYELGLHEVDFVVTLPGGECQKISCHCHVLGDLRVSDPVGEATPPWADIKVAELAFVPVFKSGHFTGYEATVILRLGGALAEPPEGYPVEYRVEMVLAADGLPEQNAVCLVGERDTSHRWSRWVWRKEWQVFGEDGWSTLMSEIAPLDPPNSENIRVRMMLPRDFDPATLSEWSVRVRVDDQVKDEVRVTGLGAWQTESGP